MYRYYACLAAQARLAPIAEDYAERWEDAVARGGRPAGHYRAFRGRRRRERARSQPRTCRRLPPPVREDRAHPGTRPTSCRPSPTPTPRATC